MSSNTMKKPTVLLLGVLLLQYSCSLHFAIPSANSNFTDQSALLDIQSKLTFDPTKTVLGGNWTTTTSFCNWIGVSCSKRRQRVTALNLPYMGLQGTISAHVGNLSFLVSLDLRNNSLFGFLPHEISRLHRLRILVLQDNLLEGNIPPTLYHCQQLEIISLAANRLNGLIPKELGFLPRLRQLYLGKNSLMSGEIPSSLGNISTLNRLSLDQCGLTGSFPYSLLNLSSLVAISLYDNNISGILPTDICDNHWHNVQILSVSFNNFSGQIPSRIHLCAQLVSLSLSYNSLVGSIPREIGSLQYLEELYLGGNNLTGTIPPTIGNITNLKYLGVELNTIKGSIPPQLGRLSNLISFLFSSNGLTGELPPEIFNISSLKRLSGSDNSLSGKFPTSYGVHLPNLETFQFSNNHITGDIPSYFSNFTHLILTDLDNNLLYGPIPMTLGSLMYLQHLNLEINQLTGETGVAKLRFLSSLFNSSSLQRIILSGNPLNGVIPDYSGNFSSLQVLYAPWCQIQGHIPKTLGSFKSLTYFLLTNNNLRGEIPSSIGGLEMLQRLYLGDNKIDGFIPDEVCLMSSLGELSIGNNDISGSIPHCIGNVSQLQKVFLNSNRLTSPIPVNLWNLENLLYLNLSSNYFSGYLPVSLKKSNSIQGLDLSQNQITGEIPSIVGDFQSLAYLDFSKNLLIGSVQQTLGDLKGLEFLDLSYNNLSGTIPRPLETLQYLSYLNVSFNQLSGEIPSGGPFANFTAKSFFANKDLCGRPDFGVPPCSSHITQKSKTERNRLKYVLPVIASTIILLAVIYMLTKYQRRNADIRSSDTNLMAREPAFMSYNDLCRATNDFCESNSLGVGSFGSVYKGILFDGTTVAIKVLNLQREGAYKSFDAECKVWRTMRHRNLVKVITICSSPDIRALVLEYMSNGSLEKWLYSHSYCLNLLQRVSILVDISSALGYLHHGQPELVVHCDLKPSNILLDQDMVGHVADFGIAKVLAENKDTTQTKTLGTIGYVAPEYGSEGRVSARGDVYSFGIMLLEIMTRKKPTEEMFSEEQTLRQWINESIPDRIMEVVDEGLLSIEDARDVKMLQSILLSIMELGLECCHESPDDRIDIKNVVIKLNKTKLALVHDRNHSAFQSDRGNTSRTWT